MTIPQMQLETKQIQKPLSKGTWTWEMWVNVGVHSECLVNLYPSM